MDEEYSDSYEENELVNSDLDEDEPLIGKKEELSSKHESIIDETKQTMLYVTLLGLFTSIIATTRVYVFILYSLSLANYNDDNSSHDDLFYHYFPIICVMLSLNWLFGGIFGYFELIITKRWRFDNLLCFCVFFETFCMCFEATAWNFTILSIFYVLNGISQAITCIITSYIYHIMPLYYSQRYIQIYNHWFMIGYIISPCIAGIICYYFNSTKIVFYVLNGISVLHLGFCIYFVFNKESPLLDKQLSMLNDYHQHTIVERPQSSMNENRLKRQLMVGSSNMNGNGYGGQNSSNNGSKYYYYQCGQQPQQHRSIVINAQSVKESILDATTADALNDNDCILYDNIGMCYSDSHGSRVSLDLTFIDNIDELNGGNNNNNYGNNDNGSKLMNGSSEATTLQTISLSRNDSATIFENQILEESQEASLQNRFASSYQEQQPLSPQQQRQQQQELHLMKHKWLLSNNFRFPICLKKKKKIRFEKAKISTQNNNNNSSHVQGENMTQTKNQNSNKNTTVTVAAVAVCPAAQKTVLIAKNSLDLQVSNQQQEIVDSSGGDDGDSAMTAAKKEGDGNSYCFKWFIHVNGCIQNSLITCIEIIFASYFFVYMQLKQNSIMISSIMASEFCLFVIIGMKFIQFSNSKIHLRNNDGSDNNSNNVATTNNSMSKLSFYSILVICQMVSCIVIILLCLVIYPNWLNLDSSSYLSNNVETGFGDIFERFDPFWVYTGILGLMIGISMMCSQSIIKELKIKGVSVSMKMRQNSNNNDGKRSMPDNEANALNVNNVASEYFINCCVKAAVLLVTGLSCVYYTFDWFWYMQAALSCLILLSTISICMMHKEEGELEGEGEDSSEKDIINTNIRIHNDSVSNPYLYNISKPKSICNV